MTTKEAVSLEYRKKWLGMLKDIVLKHVDTNEYAVFLYGSAVNGLLKAHDFDIGVMGNKAFPDRVRYKITDEIEESIIPMKVDFVDFIYTDEEFRKIALSEIEIWNNPKGIKIS